MYVTFVPSVTGLILSKIYTAVSNKVFYTVIISSSHKNISVISAVFRKNMSYYYNFHVIISVLPCNQDQVL